MNHSLLSRFQGSLFGSLIGPKIIPSEGSFFTWKTLSSTLILKLLENGEISQQDCQEIAGNIQDLKPGELILGTLPLILFFHQEPSLFWQQIDPLIYHGKIVPSTVEELRCGLEILRLIFSNNFQISEQVNLINHLAKISPPLNQSLNQIQSYLAEGTPLTEVIKLFRQKTIEQPTIFPLSLYCFYRTPTDFRLSMTQAAQTSNPTICALTGAFSGAYNSYSGIPRNWHLALEQDQSLSLCYQQISRLWAMWAGVGNCALIEIALENLGITSTVDQQPHLSLKLISQKEY
ncbi:MAG: ADP-ribosylglycohydrolase family protein [Cyanobacteria bacterium P01_G01_bin.49]